MKTDESNSQSVDIRAYADYCTENISRLDDYCDLIINKVLFMKYILNSDYSQEDLIGGVISDNINDIAMNLENLDAMVFIKDIDDFIESRGLALKWKDFKNSELNKEMLREYKLYKLMKK